MPAADKDQCAVGSSAERGRRLWFASWPIRDTQLDNRTPSSPSRVSTDDYLQDRERAKRRADKHRSSGGCSPPLNDDLTPSSENQAPRSNNNRLPALAKMQSDALLDQSTSENL